MNTASVQKIAGEEKPVLPAGTGEGKAMALSADTGRAAAQAKHYAEIIHDVRQGVHAAGLHLESLVQTHARSRSVGQEGEQALQAISQSLAWLNDLLSNASDLTCVDAGTVRAVLAPVEVAPLAQAVIMQLAPAAERVGVRVVALVANDRWVTADEHLLRRVLANLLDNAIKFSPRGANIVIALRQGEGSQWRLQVRDAGPGFAADTEPARLPAAVRLSTATRPQGKGTGLGLALSRRLVFLMKGTLLATSSSGRGSVMTVTLARDACSV